ncbi:MAG TPA: dual specificity protein phosphatase [Gemmatimonadales bacterium]|nr:dual specificity protein phosphatase [Gemmatimonadales bacterium]
MAGADRRLLSERLLEGWLGRSQFVRTAWMAWLRFRNELSGNRPTEVEPGYWIGGEPTPRRWRELGNAGVTHVVSLVGETPPPGWLASAATVLWLPVRDRAAPTAAQLRIGVEFLEAARAAQRSAFVYCGSGVGRSATLYLAWLVAREGGTVMEMLETLRLRRPVVAPTGRQMAALESWRSVTLLGRTAS